MRFPFVLSAKFGAISGPSEARPNSSDGLLPRLRCALWVSGRAFFGMESLHGELGVAISTSTNGVAMTDHAIAQPRRCESIARQMAPRAQLLGVELRAEGLHR